MGEQDAKKPNSRRGLIIKRTTAVWAIMSGLMIMGKNLTYDQVWFHVAPWSLLAILFVLVPEAFRVSIQKRRLAKEKKKRARETAGKRPSAEVEGFAQFERNVRQIEAAGKRPSAEEEGTLKAEIEQVAAQRIDRRSKDLHYWFVQYNPLSLFSAASLLLGILLVSLGLEKTSWEQGQMVLTGVVQIYEILLLVGGVMLFRKAQLHRPGLLLIFLECLFLFDCTFRTELMASLGRTGFFLSTAWIILIAFKLAFLKWLFRLKCPGTTILFPALVALGVTGTPFAMRLEIIPRETIQWIATWCGAGLLSWALWLPPALKSAFAQEENGQIVLRRLVRSAMTLWAGFYLLHVFSWGVIYSIPITLAQIVPFYLIWFFSRRGEIWQWCGGLGAAAAALSEPAIASPMTLFVGIIFLFQAWHTRRIRLVVGGILCLYLAGWTFGWQQGPLPEPRLWLNILTAIVLGLMAWRFRLLSAVAAIVPVMLPGAKDLIPHGPLQWGIFVFALGLVALVAGVLVNLSHRNSEPGDVGE